VLGGDGLKCIGVQAQQGQDGRRDLCGVDRASPR